MAAPLLSEAEWDALCNRARENDHPLVLPCCGSSGHCRISKLGTRHFVHYRRAACSWQPETAEHLLAKEAVIRGCHAAGFTAKSECSEGGWRADVLAIKSTLRLAFEIQWSSQTAEETEERQSLYAKSNVRGCWFFRRTPAMLKPQNETPAFELNFEDRAPVVNIGKRSCALTAFTEALLTRKVRFCGSLMALPQQKLLIAVAAMKCWKCHSLSTIYYIDSDLRTACGAEIPVEDVTWSDEKLEFTPAIENAVISHVVGGNLPKLGHIKRRFSRTIKRAYVSFGCANCDAIFGDWPLRDFILENRCNENREMIEVDIALPGPYSVPVPHWCFAESSQHCGITMNQMNGRRTV